MLCTRRATNVKVENLKSANPYHVMQSCWSDFKTGRKRISTGSACAISECIIQTAYQFLIAEGFVQKPYRSGAERSPSRLHFWKGSDKDNGQVTPLRDETALQFDASHARHLHVRDQAIRVLNDV